MPIPFALSGSLSRLREHLARPDVAAELDSSLLWAAVAVILVPDPDALLLIRRAERSGDPWSGHMALPGGRRESQDPDLLTTSIRETAEEVGIELSPSELVGTLEDVIPRIPVLPPVAVRPFVFLRESRPALTLNPEVTSATWVPLSHLLRPDTHHLVRLEVSGTSRLVQAYELSDAIVWGMTERILTQLLNCFKS
ncbi:MAG TPA: CoA pyrophosphatase [Gemmatimonadales bacterium]|nr:CoA pyrophosphatase [Gemmatimonadales bacterium]